MSCAARRKQQLAARDSQIETLERADLVSLAHELAVHQMELEIQNEELHRTQVEAEDARDRYLDLYDFAPVGYFTLDEHNRIVEANLTGCRLLNTERQDLLQTRFTKFIREEDADTFYFHRKERARRRCQADVRAENARRRTALLSTHGWRASSRERAGCAWPCIDVTERKRAEEALQEANETLEQRVAERTEALRESEEQFRTFFHMAAVGTAQLALDGRFLEVNDRLCDIMGYRREELLRMTPADLTHPDDRRREDEYLSAYLQGLTPSYEREKRQVRKDGQVIWVQVTAALIRDAQGQPLRSAGVIQDITDRKRIEEILRVKDSAIASSLNAIAMADLQGRLTYVNPAFLRLWGYDDEHEVLGRSVLDFWEEPPAGGGDRAGRSQRGRLDGRIGWPSERMEGAGICTSPPAPCSIMRVLPFA